MRDSLRKNYSVFSLFISTAYPLARAKASISDLAKQLGISVSTVSRALSNHPSISDATKKKVWKLAKELHYQPNHLAAGLRKDRKSVV